MINWEEEIKSVKEITNPKGTPLEYGKYKEYEIVPFGPGQWRFKFENDYGASVAKHYGTYGYEEDKFELAVLHFDESGNSSLTYDTPITNDVIGWLTNDEVLEYLERIKDMEKNETV